MLNKLYLQDAGGLPTQDGRTVRTGVLFRSSGLERLTRPELDRLIALNVGHVVDLRDKRTAARKPDRFLAQRVTHLPVRLAGLETLRMRDVLLGRVDWDALVHPSLYAEMIDNNGPLIRTFLETLSLETGPVLIHCAAGKDRTGVFVALTQLALGVERQRVVDGYLTIRPHLDAHFPNTLRRVMKHLGVSPMAYTVQEAFMQNMMTHLESHHGGVHAYLRSIGFTGMDALRARMLG